MVNLIDEMDRAAQFILATWHAVVMGTITAPPGAPQLRFDTINQRTKYANSIKPGNALDMPEAGQFQRTIIATDQIAELTEQGYAPWDMKPMLLGGPKARMGKNGHIFNIIPFRHGAPGQSGENAHFKNMPKNIYEAAKQLTPSLATTKGTSGRSVVLKYGDRINTKDHGHLLGPPKTKVIHRLIGGGGYTHKSDIHEGMIKVQADYGKATQSKYLTFRVVSEASHPLSWFHPGRPPQPHVQFVSDHCKPIIERKLAEAAQRDFIIFDGVGMKVTVGG